MTFEYTAEITKDMVATYNEAIEGGQDARDAAVEDLAAKYGIKVNQVRGKLVREGVYVAKAKERKVAQTKDRLVMAIAEALELDEEALDTLAKATKDALVKIFGKVNALREEAGRDTIAVK
jgi:hypothetical protein